MINSIIYQPTKYLFENIKKYSNINHTLLTYNIQIRISDYTNINERKQIYNILNNELYYINILDIDCYNASILPFNKTSLLIEIIAKHNYIPLRKLLYKLCLEEVKEINMYLIGITMEMYKKYGFIHGNLSLDNIYINYSETKRDVKFQFNLIKLYTNIEIYIDDTYTGIFFNKDFCNYNNKLNIEKYNLFTEIITITNITLLLLKDLTLAFQLSHKLINDALINKYNLQMIARTLAYVKTQDSFHLARMYQITEKLLSYFMVFTSFEN